MKGLTRRTFMKGSLVGTAAALYGISAAFSLSLLGPAGMRELGQNIIHKLQYAMKRLCELQGVTIKFDAFHFKEFVVDFSATGRSVEEINQALLADGIFGGKDLGDDFEAHDHRQHEDGQQCD